tara:strand:- start:214 stop:1026 length:813 start_codon:yes stop_codon:yes gene_type:complete
MKKKKISESILTTDAREDATIGPDGFITINFAYNIGIGLSPSIMEPHADGRGASQVNDDSYESGIQQRDLKMEKWILSQSASYRYNQRRLGLTDSIMLEGIDRLEDNNHPSGVNEIEVEKWGGDDCIHSTTDYEFSSGVKVDAEFRYIVFREVQTLDKFEYIALSRKLGNGEWSLWQIYKLDDRDKFWFYVECPYIPVNYTSKDSTASVMVLKHHCAVGQLWLTEQNGYYYDFEDKELIDMYRHFVSQVREDKTNINPAYADNIFEAERS